MAYGSDGVFQQLAWIPMPRGDVEGVEVMESWRQRLREPVGSRLPGMLSKWNALLANGSWGGKGLIVEVCMGLGWSSVYF